ncbi:MAG TPA: hypothetical protein VGI79_04835 [Caulobacteraceae bacterium]
MAIIAALAIPSLVSADTDPVNGAWSVKGKVQGYPVVVRCEFERRGDQLGGLCRDGDADGPAHELYESGVQGAHVSWTYHRRFLFKTYKAHYDGVVSGASMTGTISVAGYTGAFTATHQ